jgi:hypothetical protein
MIRVESLWRRRGGEAQGVADPPPKKKIEIEIILDSGIERMIVQA